MSDLSDLEEINLDPDRTKRSCGQLRGNPHASARPGEIQSGMPLWKRELHAEKIRKGRRARKAAMEGRKAP